MYKEIKDIFLKSGIDQVGFLSFSYIEDKLLKCGAAGRLPKTPKTVITALFSYKVNDIPPQKISRYSAVSDYHKVCGDILNGICEELKAKFYQTEFISFVDNSPVPEVFAAAKSGLGVVGKNGLLINEKYGSFCFIGEIVTDMEIECADNVVKECSHCGICRKVCPVGLNKKLCLSALSQKKGELTDSERKKMAKDSIVWGCDICQESCPLNKDIKKTEIDAFIKTYRNTYSPVEDITGRAYEWRGEEVIKRNYNIVIGKD